jgi:hypothetical protein
MIKSIATVAGLGLSVAFVVVFFSSRVETHALTDVAPRAGLTAEDLVAMGPRVAAQTGATLGSARRVIYLLACSGKASARTLESHANMAGNLARSQRLSDREAVASVLAQSGLGNVDTLAGC